jgi:hypothetical protein
VKDYYVGQPVARALRDAQLGTRLTVMLLVA